jgi:hypothetical protein
MSFPRRPFNEYLCLPKLSSQERAAMSTSLFRQAMVSTLTENFLASRAPAREIIIEQTRQHTFIVRAQR